MEPCGFGRGVINGTDCGVHERPMIECNAYLSAQVAALEKERDHWHAHYDAAMAMWKQVEMTHLAPSGPTSPPSPESSPSAGRGPVGDHDAWCEAPSGASQCACEHRRRYSMTDAERRVVEKAVKLVKFMGRGASPLSEWIEFCVEVESLAREGT